MLLQAVKALAYHLALEACIQSPWAHSPSQRGLLRARLHGQRLGQLRLRHAARGGPQRGRASEHFIHHHGCAALAGARGRR